MSAADRVRELFLRDAELRVRAGLRESSREGSSREGPSQGRRVATLVVATLLFAGTFVARVTVTDPSSLIANFYTVPIALLAIEFGLRGGLIAAVVALLLVYAWGEVDSVSVGWLGYASRGAAFVLIGGLVGSFSQRLRGDIAMRQRAQRELSLYAGQLTDANSQLLQSVQRLEAFAQIARAVGGETELDRVLSVILEQGREILHARAMAVCLPDGDALRALTTEPPGRPGLPGCGTPLRFALEGSLAGDVMRSGRPLRCSAAAEAQRMAQFGPQASEALLVALTFRGETLGVLAAIDQLDGRPFSDDDQELLDSIAASAATAVATARSVAAERLRLSLEAAEQARGRWARELHDDTLQGLSGVRMVLAAGVARGDLASLRRAAASTDQHLAAELARLRDLIAELRPAALDDLGLGPAIETLVQRQAAAGGFTVSAAVHLKAGERLERETESSIYRLVQEALTNAAKHADARHVSVDVSRLADRVEINVQDDGRGFDPVGANGGFGLIGMRERAALAGGRLEVSSQAGGPTRVSAVLPLRG